ncbi:hypothetical protein [Sphingobacterium sp.]|uniref:hypothetical protein n=1 Tax=Sphingobacterium sp. TaxID=341027 RepID=UPI0028B1E607|nr:hypothetical protein [Sphingobacterium sp.]
MVIINIFSILDLNHALAVLGIIVTAYGYFFIKTSKFVVIKRVSDVALKQFSDIEIKLNNIKVNANVYHYRCVIYYRGPHDIEDTEIKEPFIIYSESENCKWHNLKIIKNSTGFKPTIRVNKNQIIITNTYFKSGDSFEIDFLLESETRSIYFGHRILNVSRKPIIYNRDNKSFLDSFGFLAALSAILFIFTYAQIRDFKNSIENRPQFGIDYYYLGNKVSPDNNWQYFKDIQIDSIYTEKLLEEYGSNNKKDSINFYSSAGKFRFISPNTLSIVEIDLPSLKAQTLYDKLNTDRKLKYDHYYKIDNDLKVRFINTKNLDFNDWSTIFLFSVFLIGSFFSFYAALDSLIKSILIRNAIRNLNE